MWVCGFFYRVKTPEMSRISIDVTAEQHRRLKAIAALSGKSVKDYVLERTLPPAQTDEALRELEAFLEPRIRSARSGAYVDQTVEEIFDAVAEEKGG
jgi:hypothetical protein